MRHKLRIEAVPEPHLLQRVLVAVSGRGFVPVRVESSKQGSLLRIDLELEGDRPAQPLARRLQRLVNISRVEVADEGLPREVQLGEVEEAARRLAAFLRPSPAVYCERWRAWLKLESLHPTGAFEVRGALNAVLAEIEQGDRRPLAAVDQGNHARALAWAGQRLGLAVHVFAHGDTHPSRAVACRELDAEVTQSEANLAETEEYARSLAQRNGWRFVSPCDDLDILAGQGTAARELVEVRPAIVILPAGAGSLAAGMRPVLKAHGIEAVGVRIERGEGRVRAGEDEVEGEALPAQVPKEGFLAPQPSGRPFAQPDFHGAFDQTVTIGQDELRSALAELVKIEGIAADAAGASSVAALRRRAYGRKAAIVTGGDFDSGLLVEILSAQSAPCSAPDASTPRSRSLQENRSEDLGQEHEEEKRR